MRTLLLSNSTMPGQPYLEWPRPLIDRFLGETPRTILFIPYAGVTISWDEYAGMVGDSLSKISCTVRSIHNEADPVSAIANAEVIAIGGGNTFQLLAKLHKNRLIEPLQLHARANKPLMGWSAGSNVCCPTLKTTNDMPIVEPASFNALNLVPFQINAHYTDATLEGHGGESRRQRLNEFMAVNKDIRIAALSEGAALECAGDEIIVHGSELIVLQFGHDDQRHPVGRKLTPDLNGL
jgi:dipeptidase E